METAEFEMLEELDALPAKESIGLSNCDWTCSWTCIITRLPN